MIFSDKTLREMAAAQPRDLRQLQNVGGVGSFKAEQYGAQFLEIISDFQETAADRACPRQMVSGAGFYIHILLRSVGAAASVVSAAPAAGAAVPIAVAARLVGLPQGADCEGDHARKDQGDDDGRQQLGHI